MSSGDVETYCKTIMKNRVIFKLHVYFLKYIFFKTSFALLEYTGGYMRSYSCKQEVSFIRYPGWLDGMEY